MVKRKSKPKLFIGMEETNIGNFISPCCKTALSIEPPIRIACGRCGKTIPENKAIYWDWRLVGGKTTAP